MVIKKANDKKITFAYSANPNAKKVYLVGDFNQWDATARRMVKTRDGSFRAKLELAPGEYEYKFVVDGQWINDPDGTAQRANPFGSVNSVATV
jgi:1,4-alpha-glucan branching enzyme